MWLRSHDVQVADDLSLHPDFTRLKRLTVAPESGPCELRSVDGVGVPLSRLEPGDVHHDGELNGFTSLDGLYLSFFREGHDAILVASQHAGPPNKRRPFRREPFETSDMETTIRDHRIVALPERHVAVADLPDEVLDAAELQQIAGGDVEHRYELVRDARRSEVVGETLVLRDPDFPARHRARIARRTNHTICVVRGVVPDEPRCLPILRAGCAEHVSHEPDRVDTILLGRYGNPTVQGESERAPFGHVRYILRERYRDDPADHLEELLVASVVLHLAEHFGHVRDLEEDRADVDRIAGRDLEGDEAGLPPAVVRPQIVGGDHVDVVVAVRTLLVESLLERELGILPRRLPLGERDVRQMDVDGRRRGHGLLTARGDDAGERDARQQVELLHGNFLPGSMVRMDA